MSDPDEQYFEERSGYLLPRTVTTGDMHRKLLRNLLQAAGPDGLTTDETQKAVEANSGLWPDLSRVTTWLREEVAAGRATHRDGGPWISIPADSSNADDGGEVL